MAIPEIKQIYRVEGLEFTHLHMAERHVRHVELWEFFQGITEDEETMNSIIERMLNHRHLVSRILDDTKKVSY